MLTALLLSFLVFVYSVRAINCSKYTVAMNEEAYMGGVTELSSLVESSGGC